MSTELRTCALDTHDETGNGSTSLVASYYLAYTGAELLRAALFHLKLTDSRNLRVLHFPKSGSCHLIDPHSPIAAQQVADGDKIIVIGPFIFDTTVPLPQPEQLKLPAVSLREFQVNILDFQRISRIGSGWTGAIYTATDPRSGSVVTLKSMGSDPYRFEHEAKILAIANHPAVLKLLGYASPTATAKAPSSPSFAPAALCRA